MKQLLEDMLDCYEMANSPGANSSKDYLHLALAVEPLARGLRRRRLNPSFERAHSTT
jgi:hypothetical protein